MGIKITAYNVLCNLGNDINEVFEKAVNGVNTCFTESNNIIKGKNVRLGEISCELPEISDSKYNLRCNQILLKSLLPIDIPKLIEKYGKERIAVVTASTNTGVQEFEYSADIEHTKISNPASFIHEYFGLQNYYTSVSTACSSGIKAFSVAKELLDSRFSDTVIVAGVDEISKVPVFGFDSLEILSAEPTNPFSKNRLGINIGEGAGIFILERNVDEGVELLGIGETTDFYHSTTPDPDGIEAINAINIALGKSNLKPEDIDYINLHGTGTVANDLMEGTAIYNVFKDTVPASSTKSLTGHCLGASASIEVALCCKLLEQSSTKLFPHIYDGEYDNQIPPIKLVSKDMTPITVKNILCTSFGFSGTNTAMILGKGE